MKTPLVFAGMVIVFFLAIVGCHSSETSSAGQEIEPRNPASVSLSDSARQVYQEKLAEDTDHLPVRRVLEAGKVYPVDEAPLDTNFFLFRASVLDAIARRDVLSLLDACHENIKSSFGGEESLAEFVEMWQLDEDANGSRVWDILEKVLRQGGLFDRERRFFTAPYTFAAFPDEYDAFTYGVITGEGVRMRAGPSTTERIITSLTYDVVEQLPAQEKVIQRIDGEEHPWLHVKTLDGREGWVYGKYFASPIGWRAGFGRQPNGGWQMVFLVAGD